MEKSIETLLSKYLIDYKTYQVIFDLLTVLIITIINVGIGLYLKSKIEKIKLKNNQELSVFSSKLNLINKKSEIKFQKFQLEQAEVIKNLYSQLIDIKFSTNLLFNKSSYKNHHFDFKNRLTDWVNKYWTFFAYYSKNRILIDKKLIELIESDLNSLYQIYSIIVKKAEDIENFEEMCHGQTEYVYCDQYAEEGQIIKELEKLMEETENKDSEFKFTDLLTNLEKEYIELLKS